MLVVVLHPYYYVMAAREININQGSFEATPIAINLFSYDSTFTSDISKKIVEIVANDLSSSGIFRVVPHGAFIETKSGIMHRPFFPSWRQINASLLLNGDVRRHGSTIRVSFVLWDCTLEKDIYKSVLEVPEKILRRGAHKISDDIYQHITGDKGYFDTRVVYVSESGSAMKRVKRLAIMDYDGENHSFLTDGKSLVLTPRFSPSSDKILYLSYANKRPRVHMRNLKTGKDTILGDFPGMSFAPRFSPNGEKALISVAKHGATHILEINLKNMHVRKLTDGYTINTYVFPGWESNSV
jgi:TolB protein